MSSVNPIVMAYGTQALAGINGQGGVKRDVEALKPVVRTGEQVEISAASRQMKLVRDEIARLPDVRIKLVEEIRERIRNNDYPIENNLDEIAGKLAAANKDA